MIVLFNRSGKWFVGRIAKMWPTVTDVPWFACLSVGYISEAAEPMEMLSGCRLEWAQGTICLIC